MGENHLAKMPTAIYGFVLLMSGFAYVILQRTIIKQQGEGSLLAAAIGKDCKGTISLIGYLGAIPLAFVSPWIASAIYISVALMWLVPDRRIERALTEQAKE